MAWVRLTVVIFKIKLRLTDGDFLGPGWTGRNFASKANCTFKFRSGTNSQGLLVTE